MVAVRRQCLYWKEHDHIRFLVAVGPLKNLISNDLK